MRSAGSCDVAEGALAQFPYKIASVLWKYGLEEHYDQKHQGMAIPEALRLGPKEKALVLRATGMKPRAVAHGSSKRAR